MTRMSVLAVAIVLTAPPIGAAVTKEPGEKITTWTGWFSDKQCAAAKVKSEEVTPNGTACVKKCLDEGSTAVFVDPKAREMYDVKDYPTVKDDVGFYLEVTGVRDESARTISVQSVKRLGDVVQMCGLPRKKK
jgi:hypothetical protein